MSNQRAIAAALGITQATVSRALRDDPSIPLETRQRIAETARKLGYRPNTLVSALMKHVRAGKSIRQQGYIAVLADASSKTEWLSDPACKLQWDGIAERARQHGYRAECVGIGAANMAGRRLGNWLQKKEISGLILAGSAQGTGEFPPIEWARYAVAIAGGGLGGIRLDRAGSDLAYNMGCVFDELLRRGCRRIGLCLSPAAVDPQDNRRLAAFLEKQYNVPESDRIPLFPGSVRIDPLEKFRAWYECWHPDAVISLQGEEREWIEALGLSPRQLGLACLKRPAGSDLAGIDENDRLVGETVCDIVVNHITRNELGPPANPLRTLIEGTWRNGASLPDARPGR